MNVSGLLNKPLRTVLLWQLLVSAGMFACALALSGVPAAVSVLIGSLAVGISGLLASLSLSSFTLSSQGGGAGRKVSATQVVTVALLVELFRITLMLMLLVFGLTFYEAAQPGLMIAAFIVNVVIFSMAFFVREGRSGDR
jgi:ATP synthase protein I